MLAMLHGVSVEDPVCRHGRKVMTHCCLHGLALSYWGQVFCLCISRHERAHSSDAIVSGLAAALQCGCAVWPGEAKEAARVARTMCLGWGFGGVLALRRDLLVEDDNAHPTYGNIGNKYAVWNPTADVGRLPHVVSFMVRWARHGVQWWMWRCLLRCVFIVTTTEAVLEGFKYGGITLLAGNLGFGAASTLNQPWRGPDMVESSLGSCPTTIFLVLCDLFLSIFTHTDLRLEFSMTPLVA